MFIVGFTICGETKYKVVGCYYLFVYCEITDYNSKKQEIITCFVAYFKKN